MSADTIQLLRAENARLRARLDAIEPLELAQEAEEFRIHVVEERITDGEGHVLAWGPVTSTADPASDWCAPFEAETGLGWKQYLTVPYVQAHAWIAKVEAMHRVLAKSPSSSDLPGTLDVDAESTSSTSPK
jgi:hypothetical protein